MRPLELRLRNFRSYSGEHKFDFRERNLIAIVGPTGAGKTTILDAITFALYGRTPRIGKATSTLVNQREEKEASVSLRFEADGTEWEATRTIRRKGTNEHVLYRYTADFPDPEKWVMKGEVDDKIKDVLGLEYEVFTRSILLAQGQFAEFLTAGPAEKVATLKALFGFEKLDAMRELARQRSKDAEQEIAILEERLGHIKKARAHCAELQTELQSEQARQQELQTVLPKFQELNNQMHELQQAITANREHLDNIKALRLPDPQKSEKAIQKAEQAATKIQEAEERLEEAKRKATATEQALQSPDFQKQLERCQAAEPKVVLLPGLWEAAERAEQQLTNDRKKQEQTADRLEQARGNLKTAQEQLEQAEAKDGEAKRELEEAEKALLDARHQDMAVELRSGLEEGSDCPVCEQPVHDVPDVVAASGVTEAEERFKHAKANAKETAKKLTAATATRQGAAARLEAAEETLKEARDQTEKSTQAQEESQEKLDECLAILKELLGEGDPQVRLDEEKAAVEATQNEASQATANLQRALNDLDNTRSAGEGAQRALSELWTSLAGLASQLEVEVSGSADDPQAARQLLTQLQVGRNRKLSDLEAKIRTQHEDMEEAKARLEELRARHKVQKLVDVALATVEANIDNLSKRLAKEKEEAAAEDEVKKQWDIEQAKYNNYSRLSKDLVDGKFIKFLLDVKQRNLSEIGSEHFQRLSSGRYRFSEDSKFDVIDLNHAEQTRGADSLSGGETFLASLGLALALAEMVGREGGRLDAFMLDEGFGTLDPEHLDLAMEGVERLVADSDRRLVMVVSHVAEMRERVGDLLILEKDQITGDTQIVQGAGTA